MIKIPPLNPKLKRQLKKYSLEAKFKKQIKLLAQNPRHPSLNLELLEPKQHGIYSFRADRKFRALAIFRPDKNSIEVIAITKHYQ